MTLEEKISEYKQKYDVSSIVNLNHLSSLKLHQQEPWLRDTLKELYQEEYANNQRIIFTLNHSKDSKVILENLQYWLFKIDITNFFVILLTNDRDIEQYWKERDDKTSITFDHYDQDNTSELATNYQVKSMVDNRFSLKYQYK